MLCLELYCTFFTIWILGEMGKRLRQENRRNFLLLSTYHLPVLFSLHTPMEHITGF